MIYTEFSTGMSFKRVPKIPRPIRRVQHRLLASSRTARVADTPAAYMVQFLFSNAEELPLCADPLINPETHVAAADVFGLCSKRSRRIFWTLSVDLPVQLRPMLR
jgi:hypothetical protein